MDVQGHVWYFKEYHGITTMVMSKKNCGITMVTSTKYFCMTHSETHAYKNTNTIIKIHCLGMSWCVCIIPYFTTLLMITITYRLYIHYSFQHLIPYISMYYIFCRVRFVGARTTRHSQTFTQTDNNNYNNNIHIDYNIPFKVQSISSLYTLRGN